MTNLENENQQKKNNFNELKRKRQENKKSVRVNGSYVGVKGID